MSDDILNMVKECLTEHSKNMVSKDMCNGKLFSLAKWFAPIIMSISGVLIGLLMSLKTDSASAQLKITDLDRRTTVIESQFNHIDSKLDVILKRVPDDYKK